MTAFRPTSRIFRFVRSAYLENEGVAELVYAFDDEPELVERVFFTDVKPLPPERREALQAALQLLHGIAGVSYYKAKLSARMVFDDLPNTDLVRLLEEVYTHGLGEFAYVNKIALEDHLHFPKGGANAVPVGALGLPRQSLVPIGGGKDSLVTIEALRAAGEPQTVTWIGNSPLIADCAAQTGLPMLNIRREISSVLFELNKAGAPNGHIPITAVNSAILVLAAVIYGYDSVVFSNEKSASAATLEADGKAVNHQWSKGFAFEMLFGDYVRRYVAADLQYFSLLRPFSELAITRRFAGLTRYHGHFSSCNRNFKIRCEKPKDHWCGVCPKCHFVFLALAPFMPKDKLVGIFGRNLLDDLALANDFDALIEWQQHKPFECVGEAQESRAAFYALSQMPPWQGDALVARFNRDVAPHIDLKGLGLEPLMAAGAEHRIPGRLLPVLATFKAE